MKIKCSHKAYLKLDGIAKYIFEQSNSKEITAEYIKKLRHYIIEMLTQFPKSGRPCEELAPNTRKLVYQGYSIIYRIGDTHIEILTLYKENLP